MIGLHAGLPFLDTGDDGETFHETCPAKFAVDDDRQIVRDLFRDDVANRVVLSLFQIGFARLSLGHNSAKASLTDCGLSRLPTWSTRMDWRSIVDDGLIFYVLSLATSQTFCDKSKSRAFVRVTPISLLLLRALYVVCGQTV